MTYDEYEQQMNDLIDIADLHGALALDDWAEDNVDGFHSDDRSTCYACRDWASDTHFHDPMTGRLLSY